MSHFDRAQRALDVALVLGTAPLWAPALGLALAATRVDSPGPLFYRQTRMGLHQKPFEILKIRTMHPGAPPPPGVLFGGWTVRGDPRITRVGRWLRPWRIDELPQLWNVLRGEMSLVGPRPEPWTVAVALGETIPDYHLRHSVRPGLTGLCQISKDYGNFGTLEQQQVKVAHDLRWVRQRSPRLLARVLLGTPGALLRGGGIA